MPSIVLSVMNAIYFFFPAYVANTAAGLFGHGNPLDLGKNFIDGRRILGDGVTIRGSASGIAAGTLIGLAQGLLGSSLSQKILIAFLLSLGAMVGDAAGSFIKRRLGKPRGSPMFPLDQLNFVVGGLLFAALLEVRPLVEIAVIVAITPLGHLAVNRIGYQLKMKDVPW